MVGSLSYHDGKSAKEVALSQERVGTNQNIKLHCRNLGLGLAAVSSIQSVVS